MRARLVCGAAKEDFNILPAVMILTALLGILGLVGINRFTNPQERRVKFDFSNFHMEKPLTNIVVAALAMTACVLFVFLPNELPTRG